MMTYVAAGAGGLVLLILGILVSKSSSKRRQAKRIGSAVRWTYRLMNVHIDDAVIAGNTLLLTLTSVGTWGNGNKRGDRSFDAASSQSTWQYGEEHQLLASDTIGAEKYSIAIPGAAALASRLQPLIDGAPPVNLRCTGVGAVILEHCERLTITSADGRNGLAMWTQAAGVHGAKNVPVPARPEEHDPFKT